MTISLAITVYIAVARLSEGRSWPLWPWVWTGPQREPGQAVAEWTGPGGVQGQTLDGLDLGVRLGPDPDRAYSQIVFWIFFLSLFFFFSLALYDVEVEDKNKSMLPIYITG